MQLTRRLVQEANHPFSHLRYACGHGALGRGLAWRQRFVGLPTFQWAHYLLPIGTICLGTRVAVSIIICAVMRLAARPLSRSFFLLRPPSG